MSRQNRVDEPYREGIEGPDQDGWEHHAEQRSVEQRLQAEVQLALQLLLEAIKIGTGVGIGADRDHQAAGVGQGGEGHRDIARGHGQRDDAGDRAAEKREAVSGPLRLLTNVWINRWWSMKR